MTLAVERAELRGKDNWKAFVCVPSSTNLELDIRRCAASGLAQLRRCFLFSRPEHSLVDTAVLFLWRQTCAWESWFWTSAHVTVPELGRLCVQKKWHISARVFEIERSKFQKFTSKKKVLQWATDDTNCFWVTTRTVLLVEKKQTIQKSAKTVNHSLWSIFVNTDTCAA